MSKDIPNFKFIWEEEQGFGQEWVCKDGEIKLIREWEIEWEIINGEIKSQIKNHEQPPS